MSVGIETMAILMILPLIGNRSLFGYKNEINKKDRTEIRKPRYNGLGDTYEVKIKGPFRKKKD